MLSANTSSGLRGDYSQARPDFTVEQRRDDYRDADHALWRRLYARQCELLPQHACREFTAGLSRIHCADRVPDLTQASEELQAATGWRLIAVPGFIPDEPFFRHLAARRFPVTVWLRKPEEFDYLVEPDLFHDFFGHVPMLFDPRFADYVQGYGELGLKALAADALSMVARLYWYTVEFGLIENDDGLRAYGAGILSSGGETPYALDSDQPLRVRLQVRRCMRTHYRIDDYQKTYFVIRSFEQLAEAMSQDLAPIVLRLRDEPELQPDRLYAGDETVPPRRARLAA